MKNWRNHYTRNQFQILLEGTIADGKVTNAILIFWRYNSRPGNELSILKAHLLATQLTLNLTKYPDMPNPDNAYLTGDCQVEWNGETWDVNRIMDMALSIYNNPDAYTRDQILEVKNILDKINNMD